MFYIIVILISMGVIILGNCLCMPLTLDNLLYTALSTVFTTLGVVALDAVGALAVRRLLPKAWFSPLGKVFSVSKKERDFYRKLHIKKWKDKVPELGATTGFSKSTFTSPSDLSYLGRFVMENNFGMAVHLENMIVGILICFLPYYDGVLISSPGRVGIWLPVCLVNFVLNLLPLFILRYTNYTLTRLYRKELEKETTV